MRSAAVWLVLVGALLSGCELIADFDRSKLVTDAGAAGTDGGGEGGGGGETPIEDAATTDSALEDPDTDGGDEDAGF